MPGAKLAPGKPGRGIEGLNRMKICPSRWPEARRLEPDQGLYKRLRMKSAAEHVRRVLFPGLLLGFQIGAAVAGPQGGTVVGGNGNISRPNDTTTVIQQQSQNLAIDWQKFDIKQNELVQFKQPGRDAQALNRIFDQNASQIHGRIDANGRVLLMNPNGVIFGRTAHVNVNGLVAAGMANIPVDDFMVGKFKLEALDHADGVVINHGTIEAATGGDVTLVGKAIQNDGIIIASAGRVNLAAGNKITLDFDGDGLMRFAIDEAVLKNTTALDHQISNAGTIEANGGDVAIAASAAQGVFTNAINNSGLIRATRIENVGGVIRLAGHGPSSSVLNTGTIDASADEPDSTGGDVEITGENVRQAGVVRVDAANAAGTIAMQATHALELGSDSTTSAISSVDSGGVVQALGNTVTLKAGANIDASGATAGGVALVGGDVQGADPNIVNAQTTTVEEGATIIADANTDGDGGTVVVWSDGTTTFAGSISARGGAQAGNGGFAEVSGKQHILLHGFADMRAPNGEVGSLIVDPGTVILCAVAICGTQTGLDRFSDDHINSQLLLGDFGITTTTASTANGTAEDILVVDPSFALSWSANVLTLTAGRNLALDGSFTATGTAGLNLEFGASNGGGVLNLDTVLLAVANPITATGGAGSDTIFGPNEAVNWLTTATNDGSLTWTAPSPVTVNFTAADVLTGGSMTDTFNLSASFAGALNGGAGADNFIFADGITVGGSIDGGAADDRFNLGAGATIVGTIQGGANGINGDLVVGPNVANTWNINAIRGGDLGGVITFSGIENVAGGSNDDTFVLTSAAANIFLDGNAHVTNGDKINWSGFGSPANVILNSSVANGFGSSSATGG
jgi:filamentous hemagglutinin family protein